MADRELSTDPQDYITGPTRDNVDLKNGGTNRSGGVTTSDAGAALTGTAPSTVREPASGKETSEK